jgi:glycosyltransferase involved in cell wall biosynthesis
MKILMLNYEYPPVGGGASTATAQLCEHLVRSGHSVDVATMRYGDLAHTETVNGVRIFRTLSYRARPDICRTHEMATYLLGGQRLATALARQNRYDVIHAHFIIPTSPLARGIRGRTGIPYLVTCHGSDVPGYNPDRFGLEHRLLLPFWKGLVRSADALVSPSESLKKLILNRVPEAKIEVIPNGYEAGGFDASRVRKKSILLCSRLLPRKGFQYVIEALRDVSVGWQIDVVGDGTYLDGLKEAARGSKTPVVFHGWLDRKSAAFKDLYETSSIFVLPSEAENFPTVLLEAMSAGLAVVASTAGGCGEVIGDAGVLVEPRDTGGIRRIMLELIENQEKRLELSRCGLERVRLFGWESVAGRYVQLYQALTERARCGGRSGRR